MAQMDLAPLCDVLGKPYFTMSFFGEVRVGDFAIVVPSIVKACIKMEFACIHGHPHAP